MLQRNLLLSSLTPWLFEDCPVALSGGALIKSELITKLDVVVIVCSHLVAPALRVGTQRCSWGSSTQQDLHGIEVTVQLERRRCQRELDGTCMVLCLAIVAGM